MLEPIGILKKTHGVSGEVIILFNSNSSEKYKNLESVFIEIDKQPVPFFITSFIDKSANTAIVKFEDINSADSLKEFLGLPVLTEKSNIPKISGSTTKKFLNYKLFDSNNNFIGIITDVIEYTGHSVFQIIKNNKEILIPANEDLIIQINKKEKSIIMNIHEGLIDLYL